MAFLQTTLIAGKSQRELLAEGVAFVPQGRNLFGSLSVRHNLELGGITLPSRELNGRIEEVLTRFPRIRERIDNQASTMSGGEQKQVELARSLMLDPALAMLPVAATVHAPLWRGSPMTIEVTGHVPSTSLRDAAMNAVLSEASRAGVEFQIEDRLTVSPETMRRAA